MMALEDDEPYDLVCLDIMMPVMDGYQALMGIRNLEKERNIPQEKAAKVISRDVSDQKLSLIEENADRPQEGDKTSQLVPLPWT